MNDFKKIIAEEIAEEKRWSDTIIDIHEVTVEANDEVKSVVSNRGKRQNQIVRNNDMLLGDKPVPYSSNAFLQYLRKLEIAPSTYMKLTDRVREKVVRDRLEQIESGNTVKLRMRRNDDGVEVIAGVVSERYAPIPDAMILENLEPLVVNGKIELESGGRGNWRNPYGSTNYRFWERF